MTVELDVGHPVVLGPGEDETITALPSRSVAIIWAHELVDLTVSGYGPGERGPDPHIHCSHADSFYVLEGELVFGLGPDAREQVRATAGSLVVVPPNVVHTFGNQSRSDARFLNIHTPSMGFAESLRVRRDGREIAAADFDSFDPPENGGRPAGEAVVSRWGEGIPIGREATLVKANGDRTEGTYALIEAVNGPQSTGPARHVHHSHDEAFYVVDGVLSIIAAGGEVEVSAGGFAWAPRGVAHTFANRQNEPVRFLGLCFPAGIEEMLLEMSRATGPEQLAEIGARYDSEFA